MVAGDRLYNAIQVSDYMRFFPDSDLDGGLKTAWRGHHVREKGIDRLVCRADRRDTSTMSLTL